MLSNLTYALKNISTKLPNPFKVNGYASTCKKINDTQIDSIKSAIGDTELSNKVTIDSINKSALTSYLTPEYIVKPLCKLVKHLGIHGNMLEPSCANGRFVVCAEKMGLNVTGVELDPVMGLLARSACPNSDIRIGQRFEEADLTPNTFGLVMGNPPYGNIKPQANIKRFGNVNIMGYFVLRGLEMLHIGGYEIFVTSTWFMDSKIKDGRKAAADLGQLALALRLPNGCFSSEGSDLPVDILIFKRENYGSITDQLMQQTNYSDEWINTTEVTLNNETFETNSFFVNNPDCVLGDLVAPTNMFRSCEVTSTLTTEEIENKIVELGKKYLLKNAYKDTFKQVAVTLEKSVSALQYRFNELYMDKADGVIKQRKDIVKDSDGNDVANTTPFQHSKNAHKNIKCYLALKTAYTRLINAEYSNASDQEIEDARFVLNQQYNLFTASYGALNKPSNKRNLKDCSQYLRISGLERNYQPEDKKEGVLESYQAAEILSKRVFYPKVKPTSADSPEKALTISLMEYGTLNVSRVAGLLSLTEDEAIEVLKNKQLAYELPSGGYVSSVEYLNGNVQQKIDDLQNDSKFHANYLALTRCLPKRVVSTDISLPLGATWVPDHYYTEFVNHLFSDEPLFKVTHSDRFHVVRVKWGTSVYSYEHEIWGTKDYSATDIVDATLNGKPIVVYGDEVNGKRPVDTKKTLLAQSKADEIKDKFQDWIFSDLARRTDLEDIYNNTFNVYAKRDLTSISKHLYVDDCAFKPYDYQLEAAFFALLNDGTMLDMTVYSSLKKM